MKVIVIGLWRKSRLMGIVMGNSERKSKFFYSCEGFCWDFEGYFVLLLNSNSFNARFLGTNLLFFSKIKTI